jgi:RNA polymerase sigma-B factor
VARAVELNLPLTVEAAARFTGRGVDQDELRQVAALGLVKAARTYEVEGETSFLAFAQQTVTGELKHYLRDQAWIVRIPRRLHEILTALDRSKDSPDAIAAPADEVQEALGARSCRKGLPLDEVSDELAAADRELDRIETLDLVRSILAGLDRRSREILVLRYAEELGQTEIGSIVGLSQVHVSREIRRALDAARQLVEATMQGPEAI